MTAGPTRGGDAYRRYELALGLLEDDGYSLGPAPRGAAGFDDLGLGLPAIGEWRLRAYPAHPPGAYLEVGETLDTSRSYPEPAVAYEYLTHVLRPDGSGRNVSFHKDLTKAGDGLLYHWHDYPDGERRSIPRSMGPVTFRWFLEVVWFFLDDPKVSVEDVVRRHPPPGAGDPA